MSASNSPVRNNEGFLEDAATWTNEVAREIAQEDDIELTEKHWEIIYFLRGGFYKQHEMSPPSNRLFVKAVREALGGDEKGDSIYLMTLFPPGTPPAKTACRIAGLPRPTNCL